MVGSARWLNSEFSTIAMDRRVVSYGFMGRAVQSCDSAIIPSSALPDFAAMSGRDDDKRHVFALIVVSCVIIHGINTPAVHLYSVTRNTTDFRYPAPSRLHRPLHLPRKDIPHPYPTPSKPQSRSSSSYLIPPALSTSMLSSELSLSLSSPSPCPPGSWCRC